MKYSKSDFFAMLPRTKDYTSVDCINDDSLDLHRGQKVIAPKQILRYEMTPEPTLENTVVTPLDVHDAGHGHLLFSLKMIRILEECGIQNIQYFPCEVVNKLTKEKLQYKVANIIGLVEALDKKKSECTIDEDGFVEDFHTLVINKRNTRGHKLFRMYENSHLVFVSGDVRQNLENNLITGVEWMGEDNWEPGTIG